jgi:hypothetical protein
MFAGGELPLAAGGPTPQLLKSSSQRAQELQTVGLARVALRSEATRPGRVQHQLLPAPAPLNRPRGRTARRPMLPLVLLRVATVLGDPASSGLQGLFVVGLPHTFAGYSSARTLHGQLRPPPPRSAPPRRKGWANGPAQFDPSCRHDRFQHNGLLPPFASHCPIEGKAQKDPGYALLTAATCPADLSIGTSMM